MNNNYNVIGTLSNPIIFEEVFKEPRFCASFLNATELFNLEADKITITTTKFNKGLKIKSTNMDVTIKVENDMLVNMEMQNAKTKYDMMVRLYYYLAELITYSQVKGSEYDKTYSAVVAILNYNMFNDKKYIREFKFRDEYGNEIEYGRIIIIELPKRNACDKIELKKWLDIFNERNLNSIKEGCGVMSDVAKKIVALNADDEMFEFLMSQEKQDRDYASQLKAEKEEARAEGLAEGRAEGIAQGLAEGRAEGHAEGHAKGKAEGLAEGKLDMAKKMKLQGISIDVISNITELPYEEIEKL